MTIPQWTTAAGLIGTPVNEGSVFNFILQATNAVNFTLISGTLPPGLSLDASSGTIGGTIPLLSSGNFFTFTVRATNTFGIADRTFIIHVQQYVTSWITVENIGTVLQESFFSLQIQANDPGDTTLQYELIAGELPEGLTFHSNGLVSGYLSAITSPYNFLVKADGAIPATRQFKITVLENGAYPPQLNTISAYELGNGLEGGNLGNIFNGSTYSFQLQAATPFTSDTITYSLYSGILPNGITLSSSGLLSGTLSSQAVQLYPIAIQITDVNNDLSMIAWFYFRTNFQQSDNLYWVVNYNTIPVDLSTLTTGTPLNFSVGSQSYQITKIPAQATISQSLINEILASGLTTINSLIVTLDSTGNYTLYQNYSGELYNIYSLVVLTSSNYVFDLGNINVGQPSIFKVLGISSSQWVRYELLTGALPDGLTLNVDSGTIEGTPTALSAGTYEFRLRVYNYSLTEDLDYSIEVVLSASFKPNKLTARIAEMGKIDWLTLLDINIIPHGSLFREADVNFGINTLPEVSILSEMDVLTTDAVATALANIIPTTLTPSHFIYTPVIDTAGKTICEAVSLKLVDAFRRSEPTSTAIPGSLDYIRGTFINAGHATHAIENWMNYYFKTSLISNQFAITGALPEFLLGDAITFHGQTLPSPFENDLTYYVIPLTPTNFRLSATLADAQAGTYISFNVNATTDVSGSLQFYFPALPLAYVNVGTGSAIAAAFNAQENIVPFGYYTMSSTEFTDTFFGTHLGHNLNTGDSIKFWEEPLPGPFIFGFTYYVIADSVTTFRLAATKSDALLGNAIAITGYVDDRTGKPFKGSFKKLLTTQNNTVVLDEANTRFDVSVEMVYVDSRFRTATDTSEIAFINQINKFGFSASTSNGVFTSDQISPVTDGSTVKLLQTLPTITPATPLNTLPHTIPTPFVSGNNYIVIRLAADKTFYLADPAFPSVPLTVFAHDFVGDIVISDKEFDVWRK